MQLNPHLVLRDVLCVPAFSFNLVSLSYKLTLQNSCVVLCSATSVIRELDPRG